MSFVNRYLHVFFTALVLLFLSACGDVSLIGIAQKNEPAPKPTIIQKSYTRQPLTRLELESLLEMTVYTGEADQYGDIILDERARHHGKAPVRFSHRSHRSRYTCNVCHIELEFSMEKGETGITREDYLDGRYCGACHNGKLAFSTEEDCSRCHQEENRTPAPTLATETQLLPKTGYGDRVNWVKALQQGVIAPQKSLFAGNEFPSMSLPAHLQQPLLWTTATPNLLVRFPHVAHVAWLDCSSCHPDLFSIKQTGTVAFDKESNLYGEFCGSCHMNVALPMNGCSRCHPRMKDRS